MSSIFDSLFHNHLCLYFLTPRFASHSPFTIQQYSFLKSGQNTQGKAEQNYFEIVANVTDNLIFFNLLYPRENNRSFQCRECKTAPGDSFTGTSLMQVFVITALFALSERTKLKDIPSNNSNREGGKRWERSFIPQESRL